MSATVSAPEIERVKGRLRKLVDRTEAAGFTAAEARTAADMVARLLRQYGLSKEDIWKPTEPDDPPSPPPPPARRPSNPRPGSVEWADQFTTKPPPGAEPSFADFYADAAPPPPRPAPPPPPPPPPPPKSSAHKVLHGDLEYTTTPPPRARKSWWRPRASWLLLLLPLAFAAFASWRASAEFRMADEWHWTSIQLAQRRAGFVIGGDALRYGARIWQTRAEAAAAAAPILWLGWLLIGRLLAKLGGRILSNRAKLLRVGRWVAAAAIIGAIVYLAWPRTVEIPPNQVWGGVPGVHYIGQAPRPWPLIAALAVGAVVLCVTDLRALLKWPSLFGKLASRLGEWKWIGICCVPGLLFTAYLFTSDNPTQVALIVLGAVVVLSILAALLFDFRDDDAASSRPSPQYLANAFRLLTGKGVPLGITYSDEGIPLRVTYPQDAHIITLAMTGSGKNLTVQTPALLDADYVEASAIIIDPKAQITAITARWRMQQGHRVRAINGFDVLGIPSSPYNPLSTVDKKSHSFVSDTRRIVEGVVDVVDGPNSFFSVSALDFALLYTLWVIWVDGDTVFPIRPDGSPSKPDKSLIRVRELISMSAMERMKLCDALRSCEFRPIAEAAARYGSDSKDSKEVRDCVQTANVSFSILRDPGIDRVLRGGPDEIRFADLKKRRETVYLIIPPDLLDTHGKFLRLIVLSALGELFRERTIPPRPVLVMLDEFLQLGRMGLIEKSAAIIRDYRVQLWLIAQHYTGLAATYGEMQAKAFLSSAGVLQAFGVNDVTTAREISERAGRHFVSQAQESFGTSGGGGQQTNSWSRSTTFQLVEEPKWKPETIMELRRDRQLLLVPGLSDAILAARIPYLDRPDLQGRFDPDPYHGDAAAFERRARTGQWVIR